MSFNKFISVGTTGKRELVTAIAASAGAGDGNKILQTDSTGVLDPSFLPPGIDLAVESIEAGENLTAGDFVNIYDDAAVRKVRLADASLAREAHGFVLDTVLSGANVDVYTNGINNSVSGFTFGECTFLSATSPGDATATAPAETSGYINQVLGTAISATSIRFEYDAPITFL